MNKSKQPAPAGKSAPGAETPRSHPALGWVRRRLVKITRRWRTVPEAPKPVGPNWKAILNREDEPGCPASVFRQLAADLRLAGDAAAADKISSRGVAIHPQDVWLAMEHATISADLGNPADTLARWQRVVELGGDTSASKAFKNLSDCYYARGDFPTAEALVRRGMALHPEDFYLAERLGKISYAAGFTARAIEQWLELIRSHPHSNSATVHLRIGWAYCLEGLFERAEAVLSEGLARFPEEVRLANALSEVRFSMWGQNLALEKTASTSGETAEDFTAHLLRGKVEPFGRGKISLPFDLNEASQHIPAMLDFEECIAPLRDLWLAPEIDVFATWGATESRNHNFARSMASDLGKPLLCLEYGFISSLGLAINQSPQHSIIICPGSIYFDATQPGYLESRLNSEEYQLTPEEQDRAEKCIAEIIRHRITKYNHAPQIDLRSRFPDHGKKRILLMDQRFGDKSVHMGLGSEGSFERMMEAALALPDHEILIKLHPDAISGGQGSYLGRLLPDPLPPNIQVVDYEVNPFCLFEVVDEVFVCTSQAGFEALMAGKIVHCFGVPFYAGWGLTTDRLTVPRRKRQRTVEEIFHLFYINHSRYFVPDEGVAELEDLVAYLVATKTELPAIEQVIISEIKASDTDLVDAVGTDSLAILIILPSGRLGASGRYIQNLAWSLFRLGCRVMVLAEGKCAKEEGGVIWQQLDFDGAGMAAPLREAIMKFAPQIIYENGVRSRAQRAALEAMILTGARLAMQSEDDDIQIHETRHSKAAAEFLASLDKPALSVGEIARFLQNNDWQHSLRVFLNPKSDRWIEAVLRAACYRLASLHTAIWHPFESRLAREHGVPTMVVPPVASAADFERLLPTEGERERILTRYGIEPHRVVFFIGGAIYSYSHEYAVFLDALNRAAQKTGRAIALVTASGRSSLPIARMARQHLRPEIAFADIGRAEDNAYLEMLKACDVVCSPGLPDDFNRYRLPSRLVKAMAMAKPILTCECGFGESLENGMNAFLTVGDDPDQWAEAIAQCLDPEKRALVGSKGKVFAKEHFDSDRVAAALKEKFDSLLASPPHQLAASITDEQDSGNPSENVEFRHHPSITLRNRNHSSMQDAVHLIASYTNRLDTVVHIGAGRCGELEDYCRLGAGFVVLVEASPRLATALARQRNFDDRILVKQQAVAATGGPHPLYRMIHARPGTADYEEASLIRPTGLAERMPGIRINREGEISADTLSEVCEGLSLENPDNLLVLELQGLEARVLETTPAELLRGFRWIAVSVSDSDLFEDGPTRDRVAKALGSAGFTPVPAPHNYSDLMVSTLFQRQGEKS